MNLKKLSKKSILMYILVLLVTVPVAVGAIHYLMEKNIDLQSEGFVIELRDTDGLIITEIQGLNLWVGESDFVEFQLNNIYDNSLSVALNMNFSVGFCMGSADTYRYKLNGVGDYVTVGLGDWIIVPTTEFIEVKMAIYNYGAETGSGYSALLSVNVEG